MAGYLDINCVKYACTCGLLKTLPYLYYCRYCSELRCSYCVTHEVDSYYCSKCCENLPSPEAKMKNNKCSNCYICPSCGQDLSTRAASKISSNPDDSKTSKKTYYLLCLCCKWSTRDIGIPDQTSVTGGWPTRENIHGNRIQEIIDMYNNMLISEKQAKEIFKKKQKGRYISYTDKTGLTAAVLRKRIGLPENVPLIQPKSQVKKVAPGQAEENVDDFPEHLLTQPVNLLETTTLEQRLMQVDSQPMEINKIFPFQKMLVLKTSLRCRKCEHNVSKPEYSPNTIKFKIQLFAYYHIPDIRIVTVEPLRAGKPSELILRFTNPTQHETTISFIEFYSNVEQENEASTENKELTKSTLANQLSTMVKPRKINLELNSVVIIPNSTFILPPRDDAAEYDDFNEPQNIQDDPKLVVWRKSNKAFVKLMVTPSEVPLNTSILAGFTMSHLYTNTITSTIENKEPQKINHEVKIFLDLGKTVGSTP